MRAVKNALGMANTSSTYGTTLPMGGSNLQSGYGSNLGYGNNLGYGSGFTGGYGAQSYGQGFGTSGLSSGYGAQNFGTSGLASPLPAQAVVQTTTVPIDTPASPMMSQSPTMTPSSFSGQQGFSNQNQGFSNLGQGQQFGQGLQGQQFNQGLQGQQFSQGLQGQQFNQGLQGQQLGQSQWSGQQFNQGLSQGAIPVQKQFQQGTVQRREVAPVVHERIRREEVEEIQPVIHREREKTEVHKITQPIQTSSTLGIITEEGTLPAQVNPEIRTPGMMCPPAPLPTREQLSGQRMRVEKPAVVIETEKRNIIEEVQPVVYKEIVEPHIIRLTQPIYERIVEGEVYFNESLPARAENFQQPMQQQQLPLQQGQHFLQPIQVQTLVQPIPVPMASPVISQPLMKENLEVAATYVSDIPSTKGRYGHKYSKGSAYAYGPGTTGAPLAQPRAV